MPNFKSSIAWLKGCVARCLPPCKQIVLLLSQAMDRPLPIRDRLVVKTHLAICPSCDLCQEQLDMIRKLLRNTSSQTEIGDNGLSGATLSPETRERLKKLLSTTSSNI